MSKKVLIFKLIFIGIYVNALASERVEALHSDVTYLQGLTQQLDAYMQALTKLNRFSGTVIVAKKNTILLNRGYGFANCEFDVPNTSQTKFRICSITKMITASAIMLLQERGLLHVNDPISKYVPDYPRGNEITIHHLLTHTSGLPTCNLPLEMVVLPTGLEQILSFFKGKLLEYKPGADYKYSNAGYSVLSYIIEKISGRTYESFIKDTILEPLRMNESSFGDYDYEILKNCASGYCFNQANKMVNGHYVYVSNCSGGGGLCCTAHDLYKFAWALSSGTLLKQESLGSMFRPYHDKESYGYGCHIQRLFNRKLIEHGGMLSSGFKSNLSLFVDDEVVIIVLSNCFSSWVNEARNALAAIMFGYSYDFPSCKLIKLDSAIYNDYLGAYDHPFFTAGYTIERRGEVLLTSENVELAPVAKDQFILLNQNADNMVYTFIRDEEGKVVQLRIKGGGPYFELRCNKISIVTCSEIKTKIL